MFYVYLIYKNNLIIYVGKGSGKRYLESLEERCGDSYKIVFKTSYEDEAFRMEDYLWKQLIRRGFELLNQVRPGRYGQEDHRSGRKMPTHIREKIRVKTTNYWRNLSEEERLIRNEKTRKGYSTLSKSKRDDIKVKISTKILEVWKNMSSEELVKYKEKLRQAQLKRFKSEEEKSNARKWYHNMTEEERVIWLEKVRQGKKNSKKAKAGV